MKLLLTMILGLTSTTAIMAPTFSEKIPDEPQYEAFSEEVEPTGWFTMIALSVYGGNGMVMADVKNAFTLFPATVKVYVELYYSYDFQEDYKCMTHAARGYTEDLDMGKTISVNASTEGETRYWKGRTYYQKDGDEWIEKLTDTVLIDGYGNLIK